MSRRSPKQANKIKIGAWGYRQTGVGFNFGPDCCIGEFSPNGRTAELFINFLK